MADQTNISWTDHTFNKWVGCSKVSAGCANCYAATFTKNRMGLDLWGPNAKRQMTKTQPQVRKWEKEAASGVPGVSGTGKHLVFVGSLMDWAEDREDLIAPRAELWGLFKSCPHLAFQLLTKRPQNIRRFLPDDWGDGYQNVWLGTSVEDMRVAERADILRDIPAVVRFISYEPALGPLNDLDLTGIDWLICGGESGSGFRPMEIQWARDIKAKCDANGTAFFFKQSSAFRSGTGIELDGVVVRNFPIPRLVVPQEVPLAA